MKNYNGVEMFIRETNLGKFQALPENYTPSDLSRAKCFNSRTEAENYINRSMPKSEANEKTKQVEREKYFAEYSRILALPELKEMRRNIQELYGEACWESKKAGDAQRAAARGFGQKSVMGRDIGDARQREADRQADSASETFKAWGEASGQYECELQRLMTEAEIPVELYRTPLANNEKLTCTRCNHSWSQRGDTAPKFCPKCNSPYWDRPRKI